MHSFLLPLSLAFSLNFLITHLTEQLFALVHFGTSFVYCCNIYLALFLLAGVPLLSSATVCCICSLSYLIFFPSFICLLQNCARLSLRHCIVCYYVVSLSICFLNSYLEMFSCFYALQLKMSLYTCWGCRHCKLIAAAGGKGLYNNVAS